MTGSNPMRDMLDMLHRDRAAWRLRAELDPSALCSLADAVGVEVGLPRDIALRVIESELEVRPLPSPAVCHQRATVQLPRMSGPDVE